MLRLVVVLICAAAASTAHAQQPGSNPPAAERQQNSAATPPPLRQAQPPDRNRPPDPALNEQIVRLPVAVKLRDGKIHKGEFVLTTFRPNGPCPFPAVVVSHGRNAKTRSEFGRNRLLG